MKLHVTLTDPRYDPDPDARTWIYTLDWDPEYDPVDLYFEGDLEVYEFGDLHAEAEKLNEEFAREIEEALIEGESRGKRDVLEASGLYGAGMVPGSRSSRSPLEYRGTAFWELKPTTAQEEAWVHEFFEDYENTINIDEISDEAVELLIAIDDSQDIAWSKTQTASHRELLGNFLIEWLSSASELGGGRWHTTPHGHDVAVELELTD